MFVCLFICRLCFFTFIVFVSFTGDFLCDRGELEESEMIYRRGLEIGKIVFILFYFCFCTFLYYFICFVYLGPTSAKLHNGLAVLLHSYKNELNESEQLYVKAISLDSRDP
jgi:hypothetical protein